MNETTGTEVRVRASCGARFLVSSGWEKRLFQDGVFLDSSKVRSKEVLKKTGSRRVERVELADGEQVVVKTYPARRGWDGFTNPLAGGPAGDPEWSVARKMHRAGLPVAEPLAVGHRPVLAGLKSERIVVTRNVQDSEDLRAVYRSGGMEGHRRRRFVHALGRLIRRIHDAGFVLEDPHMGNFLVRWEGEDCVIVVVDLRDVRIEPDPSESVRLGNLLLLYRTLGLVVEKTCRLRFLRSYLGDGDRDTLRRWSLRLESEGVAEVRAYHRRRSRAALGENRRFGRESRGALRWQVRWSALDEELEAALNDPAAFFDEPEALLKRGNSSTVVARGSLVLKRDNYKKWTRRILDLLRPGRSLRALERAFHLEISALPTPRPLAAGKERHGLLVSRGYLVVRRLRKARNVDVAVKEATLVERRQLLEASGRLVARVHAKGFSHRDLKAGNLMADQKGDLWLVDLDGVRTTSKLGARRRGHELGRLLRDLRDRAGISEAEEAVLLAAYLERARRTGFEGSVEDVAAGFARG